MIAAPPGFTAASLWGGTLIADPGLIAPLASAGLGEPGSWLAERPAGPGTGRGPRGILRLPEVPALLVKQYLRGGLLARFNRERYFDLRRFSRELEIGRRARSAGLPVGELLGLALLPARPGWRVFGMVRLIEESLDLPRLGAADAAAAERAWPACLALVSVMHRAGLAHADLNVGNLLLSGGGGESRAVFIVDLDRAEWFEGGVPSSRRRQIAARLARSVRKVFGSEGASRFPVPKDL